MKKVTLCAACVLGTAAFANAGTFSNPSMEPGNFGIDPLILTNNEWTYGPLEESLDNDWWVSGNTIMLRENWGGGFGSVVDFNFSAQSDGSRSIVPIGILKDVTNSTTFDWTAYDILLIAGMGATIGNVNAQPNSAFNDVTITDNGDGSFLMSFGMGAGSGVPIGDNVVFDFDFEISGDVSFTIVQIPIPTPGSAAVLAIAGLAAARRRR
ncbi:MAG: hypothetical protein ACNA8P_00710 [Phycisphaerales bacterium]